ncbi:MAG TPA: phosphotransferase [Patescibacteria group bacterium]|nr:phosphotransferase [Patescibacteria group bacterium]
MEEINVVKHYLANNYNLDDKYSVELLAENGNSVFSITNGQQHYIFRIYALYKSIEVIKSEIEILRFLSSNGLNAEEPVHNCKGHYHDTIELQSTVRNCAMYKALSGVIHDEMLTEEQSKNLGLLAGKLHNILDLYTGKTSFMEFGYEELVQAPWRRIKPYIYHNKELNDFYEAIATGCDTKLRNNERLLSWGLCHGDLHAGNVIFNQDNEPGIFDFELCCYGWRLYDLATFIWSILPRDDYRNENIELVDHCIKSFIDGYMMQRALSTEELDLLFNIVLLRHIWRQAERIEFEKAVLEWRSEQHFVIQMNRMKKWIELYKINFKVI